MSMYICIYSLACGVPCWSFLSPCVTIHTDSHSSFKTRACPIPIFSNIFTGNTIQAYFFLNATIYRAYILIQNVRIQKFERGLKIDPKNKDTSISLRNSCLLDPTMLRLK